MEEKYSEVLTYMETILKEDEPACKVSDWDLEKDDMHNIEERGHAYSSYLISYVNYFGSKAKKQLRLKSWFFALTMLSLLLMVGGTTTAVILIALKPNAGYADLATAASACASVIASFIVIPKVIAANLFPGREDDRTAQLFSDMFDHDLKLRKFYLSNFREEPPKEEKDKP